MTHYHRPPSTVTLFIIDNLMAKCHIMYHTMFISEADKHLVWLEDAWRRGVFSNRDDEMFSAMDRLEAIKEQRQALEQLERQSQEPWLPDQSRFQCDEDLDWDAELYPDTDAMTEELDSEDEAKPGLDGTEDIGDLFFDLDHLINFN